ncbi:hypothetical protein NL676_005673 [Syzygium grande]|nr:hypothetical protein NL676_005673 [Syzygium grande]
MRRGKTQEDASPEGARRCGGARHMLEVISEMAASGGVGDWVGRPREVAIRLEKGTEVMSAGVDRLREGANGLFQMVIRISKRWWVCSEQGHEKGRR